MLIGEEATMNSGPKPIDDPTMSAPRNHGVRPPARSSRFRDSSALQKTAFAAISAILSVTVGAVLEKTWATPDYYLRLSPDRLPTLPTGTTMPTGGTIDTVIWRAENWGGKSLDGLVLRIGNPGCNSRIVDVFVTSQGTAIVNVGMSQLYPQNNPDQNVIEYTISSWPREGTLLLGTVFEGAREQGCFIARVVSSAHTETLIVTRAPKFWVIVRATPLLSASLAAAFLLLLLGLVYLTVSRRRS
jgi:hypothetical protein